MKQALSMRSVKFYFLLICLFIIQGVRGQNYQAINGSSYAGSLGVANNPATIVNVPFAWDITPFSVQVKLATNAIKIKNYSYLSSPANATLAVQNGYKKWFAYSTEDIHLFNTRINLNSKTAIAFGANIRNYFFVTGSGANYQDSSKTLNHFLTLNTGHEPLSANAVNSGWGELYGSIARTIYEDGNRVLNAGITLKVNRGLAGGYGKAENLTYLPANAGNNGQLYMLSTGSIQYGYSSNFDTIDSTKSGTSNRSVFLQRTNGSFSADIGFEYTFLTDEDNESGSDYAYNTKIGVSVMDIGKSKYHYGTRSRIATAGKDGISDTVIQNKFRYIKSFDAFNDSLASISNGISDIEGNFNIYQPTRLMINIDQHLTDNFFINAELTIPLIAVIARKSVYAKEMNLLAITPRWEQKSLGVYLPVTFNNQKQLWVGGAFKAGPILMGTHNLANLFSKDKSQNGGFYLALTIRPGKFYDKQSHQPNDKSSSKSIRNLQCPSL